jgi:hypothetical protein
MMKSSRWRNETHDQWKQEYVFCTVTNELFVDMTPASMTALDEDDCGDMI